jgi:hypothetical protein
MVFHWFVTKEGESAKAAKTRRCHWTMDAGHRNPVSLDHARLASSPVIRRGFLSPSVAFAGPSGKAVGRATDVVMVDARPGA